MAAHLHLTPIIPCDMFVTAALVCDIDECTLGFGGWRLLLEKLILRELDGWHDELCRRSPLLDDFGLLWRTFLQDCGLESHRQPMYCDAHDPNLLPVPAGSLPSHNDVPAVRAILQGWGVAFVGLLRLPLALYMPAYHLKATPLPTSTPWRVLQTDTELEVCLGVSRSPNAMFAAEAPLSYNYCMRSLDFLVQRNAIEYAIPFDNAIDYHQGMGIFEVFLMLIHPVPMAYRILLCAGKRL